MNEILYTEQIRTEVDSPALLGGSRLLAIVVPTYNAARCWPALSAALTRQGVDPAQVLIIDSSSTDDTRALAAASNYRVVCIPHKDFRHGRTRQLAATLVPEAEYLLYLTQDAVPEGLGAIQRLQQALEDPATGAAYGRQLPRVGAGPIEQHARLFNYPAVSALRTFDDRHSSGIRAAFFSNSFAIYRRAALAKIGGFPESVIVGEDTWVAAKLLMEGWKVAYVADATVLHSHSFTFAQEFSRYFDIGINHNREAWILNSFGSADHEGRRFVLSELRFLKGQPLRIGEALLRTLGKILSYRLGRMWLSGTPSFWAKATPKE